MRGITFMFVAALAATAPIASGFDPSEWQLAFEDDFERPELGPHWDVPNGRIVDGRLRYGDDGMHLALITRPFADDVRIEFEAEAVPERTPCDLSAGLACTRLGERGYGYILAFGGMNNTGNQIAGGGDMKRASMMYPEKRIEHGKVYRIAARKEGTTLSLEVDGEVLLTTTDKDPLGGPTHDLAGLVTWNGMFADNVRVYERKEAHPDTPVYVSSLPGLPLALNDERGLTLVEGTPSDAVREGIRLYNEGRPCEAEAAFLRPTDPALRAAGVAYCVGYLDYDATLEDNRRAGQRLTEWAESLPADNEARKYAELGRQAARLTVLRAEGLPNGELAATRILGMGEAENPFYDAALMAKARLLRAHQQEGARSRASSDAMFATLRERYPDNRNLRELTGDPIPWGAEWIDDDSDAPAWARYLRELYSRQCAVLRWWFSERQFPTGELGGGWGDDVEILRTWTPVAVISTGAPAIVDGIERLADGTWRHVLGDCGFAGFGDVEHSSEPSADTLPAMMLLRWGSPLWIERNMRAARQIRDVYMGVNDVGLYQFRSAFFGGDRAGETVEESGDNGYCTRPARHLQHLALWGNPEAQRVYLSWADNWLRQTMAEYPDKQPGLVPNTLWFPDGDIVGPGYSAHWERDQHYFHQCPGMAHMIQGTFLNAFLLTGERRYLEPMQIYMRRHSTGPLVQEEPEPGTLEWAIRGCQYSGDRDALAQFRAVTGDRTCDEYLLRFGAPTQRYLVTNDLDAYIGAIERAAKAMRTNFRLLTEEVLQTDRAGLPGSQHSYGAFTGGLTPWRDAYVPDMAVTWEAPDTEFAALVVASAPDRLRVWIYSFHDDPVTYGMRLWNLVPGRHEAVHGEILPGEGPNHRYAWSAPETFTFRRRLDTYRVDVPPRVPYAVDLRLVEGVEVPAEAPDPAIGPGDVERTSDGKVRVTVHNLGAAPCPPVPISLQVNIGAGWVQPVAKATGRLPMPKLEPVKQVVVLDDFAPQEELRVVLDAKGEVEELYEGNNQVVIPPSQPLAHLPVSQWEIMRILHSETTPAQKAEALEPFVALGSSQKDIERTLGREHDVDDNGGYVYQSTWTYHPSGLIIDFDHRRCWRIAYRSMWTGGHGVLAEDRRLWRMPARSQ